MATTLAVIEEKTKEFADSRELLSILISNLHDDIEELKRKRLPEIKKAASETAAAKEKLADLIDDSRELFKKPKSLIISGVRVGLKKGSGKLEFEDEDMVIRLIRKHLPQEQQELLIKTIEKVVKKALSELDAATLKKVGVTIEGTGDVVLIKPVDSEIDKLINAMLKEAEVDDETGDMEVAA